MYSDGDTVVPNVSIVLKLYHAQSKHIIRKKSIKEWSLTVRYKRDCKFDSMINSVQCSWGGLAQSVECLSYHMLWGSGPLDPGLKPHQCLYATMQMKQLSCHAGYQEVSRCHTRGESEESIVYRQWSMQARESTLTLKPSSDPIRNPNQGCQWPHKKDLCLPIF